MIMLRMGGKRFDQRFPDPSVFILVNAINCRFMSEVYVRSLVIQYMQRQPIMLGTVEK